jgi:hypothetical protein
MLRRIIAALAFLHGGALTWLLLALAKGYGASQAGMSAGTHNGPSSNDALVVGLLCSYFVVSAIGVMVCTSKRSLKIAATVAHLIPLVVFFWGSIKTGIESSGDSLRGIFRLAGIAVFYFMPWVVLWSYLLLTSSPSDQPDSNREAAS